MTTPTSALGLSHIQTEFGGSNPIGMSEYYGVNANVASSGEHRMARFLGISASTPSAQVLARDGYDFGIFSANSSTIHHTANGICVVNGSAGNYSWLLGGANTDYEIRATRTNATGLGSLAFSTGWANNTWIGLGTTRTVYNRVTSIGIHTATASISIRWASNGTIIQTATHTYTVEIKK
jgi:hypothetical protein